MQHPDEGTIHGWIDGALPDEEARAVDEHVATCAECAARAAEERGLVAGASRILGALDDVPARVVPGGAARGSRTASHAAWWRRPAVGVAAAMMIVAVGTTMVVTRDWQQRAPSAAESSSPIVVGAMGDSAMRVDTAAARTDVVAEVPISADAIQEAQLPRRTVLRAPAAPPPVPAPSGQRAQERVAAAPSEPLRQVEQRAIQLERDEGAEAAKARNEVAGESAAAMTRVLRDSLARVEMPRLADLAEAQRARSQGRAREAAPPVVGGHTLMTTATGLAGCYALELQQPTDGAGPQLPSVVQLALSARDAARDVVAPPAQGFNRSQAPLLVPPADDSAQLGWRLANADSVAVRLASDGRAVLVTFPAVVLEPRMGFATTAELPGVPSWAGPVLVQRVPCP